jgi:FecR protein
MEGVMATCTATGGRLLLLRAALLVTTGLVLSIGSPAWARVGVTSGADGDPLGKPPNENERILRIGIDVQANELITTAANDRAHLVFIDGSSLTVGPDARLTIDRFVFDPNTQKGELAINASKGVLRLVGGKISKTNAITITTPSSTIGIRGGIAIFSVNQVQTIADFVFGNSMKVTAGGQTQTATRAGSQVITDFGGVPGAVTLMKPGSVSALLSNLEGAKSNSDNSADQSAQKSGFSNKNSGQAANAPNFNQNQPPNTNNNTLTNAVSFSNPAGQPLGNSTLQNQKTLTTNTLTTNTLTTTTPTTTTPTTTTPTTTNNNPPPSGPTRTSQTLTGFASGLVVIVRQGDDSDDSSTRVRHLRPGTVSITTDATNNQASGTIVTGLNGSHHHPATATLQFGGAGSSTFTDDKNYTMTNNPSRPSTVKIGDATYRVDATNVLASASSSSTCTCEFLSFGAWTSVVADPRNHDKTYTAYGTYVAGTPTTAVQLPQMGSASYRGFMAGFASNNGQVPVPASGTYRNDWNFQTGSGVFTGSFDNRNYSGTTQATGSGPAFAGRFSGGGGSGRLNGAFFASPSDAAAYQAGTFSIGNARSRYQAAGVFGGQR